MNHLKKEPELPGVVVSIISGSEEVPTVIAPFGSTFAILVIVLKFVFHQTLLKQILFQH